MTLALLPQRAVQIERVRLTACTIPTDRPESDGTLEWDSTTIIVVELDAGAGVTWFEEPVSSDDLAGLARIRDRAPPGVEIAAGEYGYDLSYFERMLHAGAVDVLQADATRCGGLTGFLQLGPLCDATATPLSAHTAPALHLHLGCAMLMVRHLEYFHDHVRIEQMLFDGVAVFSDGMLSPDLSRTGLGLELKRADAAPYVVFESVLDAA